MRNWISVLARHRTAKGVRAGARSRNRWPTTLATLAACAGLGCARQALGPSRPVPGPTGGALLPSTPVVTLEGAATDLRRVLRGRVAIVSLWATWCEACVGEIDALNRLQAQAARRDDAVVVGVAVGEDRETVAAFARRRGLTYAQWVDEAFRLADALGEPRVPATLVVDRGGQIVFRGGALDPAGLAAFRSALRGGP
jgi:cytochrome c biogenesis protein CcmG, thiol:disulfide interchange protein DsbE